MEIPVIKLSGAALLIIYSGFTNKLFALDLLTLPVAMMG